MRKVLGFLTMCFVFLIVHSGYTHAFAQGSSLEYFHNQKYTVNFDDVTGRHEIKLVEDPPIMEQTNDNGIKSYLKVQPVITYNEYDGLQFSINLEYRINEIANIDSIIIKTNEYRGYFSVDRSKVISTISGKQSKVSINFNNENLKLISSMCDDQQDITIRLVSSFDNYDFSINGDNQSLFAQLYNAYQNSGISISEKKDENTKLSSLQLIPSGIYEKAEKLEAKGKYLEAAFTFLEVESYLDSKDRALKCQNQHAYEYAQNLLELGYYDEAQSRFEILGDFKDSKEKSELCIEKKQTEEKNGLYTKATELFKNSEYESARDIFLELGSLNDSINFVDKCNEMIYQQAILFEELGEFEKAIDELSIIGDYKDTISHLNECKIGMALKIINDTSLSDRVAEAVSILEDIDSSTINYENLRSAKYLLAKKLVINGDYTTAISEYSEIVDFEDSRYLLACTERLRRARAYKQICFYNGKLYALMGNGKVHVFGSDQSVEKINESVSSWEDVIQIDLYDFSSPIGLKSDGTVYYSEDSAKSLSKWKNIVKVEADSNYILGLQSSGRVVSLNSFSLHKSTPRSIFDCGQYKTSGWRDIKDISTGVWFSLGLDKNGKVVVAGQIHDHDINRAPNIKNWSNIVKILATDFFCTALDEGGNVFISDRGNKLFSNVSSVWAGEQTILAKCYNGTYSMYVNEPDKKGTVISNIVPPSDELADFYIDEDVIIGIANQGDNLFVYANDLTLRMSQYDEIDAPAINFTNGSTTIFTNGIWIYINTLGEIVGIKDFEPIKIGSRGAIVKVLQGMLVKHGYNCEQNGVFDKKTQESAVAFMQKLNISSTKNIEESFLLVLMNMI